jgi:nicotinamidase-related amidase
LIPLNDFLFENGKLWSSTKETVKGVKPIENLKHILSAVRSSRIKVIYVSHHRTEKGDWLEIPGSLSWNNSQYATPSLLRVRPNSSPLCSNSLDKLGSIL